MKKGFTLIELLAVIVILAIISLIAVPIMLNVIEKSKQGAFKNSVMNAMNSTEYYMIEKKITSFPEEGISVTELKLSKSKLISGRILKNSSNKLVALNITDGEYCAQGAINNLTITKGECRSIKPNVTLSSNNKKIIINGTDDYGIIEYAITNSSEMPTEWIEIEETTSFTLEYETTESNDYYVYLKNKYNEVSVETINMSEDLYCAYEVGHVWNFDYIGSEQEFNVLCDGKYKIETWGAQGNYGGKDNMPASQAGKGAYTVGTIGLNQNDKLYIYVGENNHASDYSIENATFNGGGNSISRQNNEGYYGAAGGGATDIRLVNGNWNDSSSLNSRIMVAAGGGSGSSGIRDGHSLTSYSTKGGAGGTLIGENASGIYNSSNVSATYLAKGGTQTSGGAIGSYDSRYGIPSVGLFGIGGTSSTPSSANGNYSQGGGGGGWYGGAGGSHYQNVAMSGGAGGSSYISGHAGCVANISATSSAPKNGCANGTTDIECSKHYSGYVFTDTNMISGNESMPTHDGKSTMIGNYNSGYAKITYLGK